jgi:hypothetical protein
MRKKECERKGRIENERERLRKEEKQRMRERYI